MIKGISDIRRLPRLGKIRLGEKAESSQGKMYPKALDHFNFKDAPEVGKVYGDKAIELDIMLPHEDPEVFFSQARRAYRKSGLFCKCSNGTDATRVRLGASDGVNTRVPKGEPYDPTGEQYLKETGEAVGIGEMYELPCPGEECQFTESKMCKPTAILMVMLPKVPGFGCYQITTGSINTIIDLNSYIDAIRAAAGRISMIPLKLRLVPKQVQVEGKAKTIHYLTMVYEGTIQSLIAAAHKIPAPVRLALPAMSDLEREVPEDLMPAGGAALDAALKPKPEARPADPEAVAKLKAAFAPKSKSADAVVVRAVGTEMPMKPEAPAKAPPATKPVYPKANPNDTEVLF